MDVRVEQGEQRQCLMNVPRSQAPGFLMQQRLLMQVEQQQLIGLDALDPADEALFVDDELVDVYRGQIVGQLHAMPGAPMALVGLDLAHTIPERAADAVIAGGKLADVIDQLIGMVILCRYATGTRLQAHVDVLGDQYHRHAGALSAQLDHLVDDLVVVQIFRQRVGLATLAHEDRKTAGRPALAALDRYAELDLFRRCITEQLVDQTNRLTTLGRDAVLAGLELIELLQHGHREGDLMFLEVQQSIGIVDQYIRVEDVERGLGRARSAVVIHTDHLLLGPETKSQKRFAAE